MAESRYFTEWEGKTLDQILSLSREMVEDPSYPICKAWREDGGKILGHFQVYFPEEIAHAAGLLPVKIRGAQSEGGESDSRFGSYLCSIIKTSLDIALTKDIELDLFVTHPICDAARNLSAVWGRNFDYKCQILYLPQNPNSEFAVEYLANEYARLKRDIEALTGKEITDEAINASIALYNKSRRQIRELYAIRRESAWLLSADESMGLIGLAGMLPREEFVDLMETVLPMIRARQVRRHDKMRVVFEGGFCELPPFDLIQTISRTCYVVDDDLYIGLRFIIEDVSTDGAPLTNLAYSYIEHSTYSPVQHDLRKPKEKMLLKRLRGADAEAVILAAAKMCEPGLEEQVAYTKTLEEENIPYVISEFEENQTTFDQMSLQLETFVENIMFD